VKNAKERCLNEKIFKRKMKTQHLAGILISFLILVLAAFREAYMIMNI
jgi:hypothetical protein